MPVGPNRRVVRYREKWPESPRGQFADDGSAIVRDLLVTWDQPTTFFDAVKDLIGYPRVVANPVGSKKYYIQRNIPGFYPLISDDGGFGTPGPFLWVSEIQELIGLDYPTQGPLPPLDAATIDRDGISRFATAKASVRYSTRTYTIMDDDTLRLLPNCLDPNGNPDEARLKRYVTVESRPQTRYLILTAGAFVFPDADGVAPGAEGVAPGSPGKEEPSVDLTVIWHHVPKAAVGMRAYNPYIIDIDPVTNERYIPPIEACLGKVNIEDWNGYKKGTLLFTAANVKRVISPIGDHIFDVEYSFRWLPVRSAVKYTVNGVSDYVWGHNLLYDDKHLVGASTGYFEVVKGPAPATSNYLLNVPLDGKNVYDYRSFDQLFRVPLLA